VRKRVLAALAAGFAAAIVVSAATAAAGGVRVASVDTAGYPRLVLNVVTQQPTSRAPRLTEDGRTVSGFEAVNLGAAKSVVVDIDNSRSMGGASLRNATGAAQTFLRQKAPGDSVSVFSFGRRPAQLTGFSTSSAEAVGVLKGLAVDGRQGTALYDSVVAAAKTLRRSQLAGRVIVLLTDGRDVSSVSTLGEAITAARSVDAAVYAIGIESRDFDSSALRSLARGTNGTYYGAGSAAALQEIYGAIGRELNRTWRVAYDTSGRPGDRLLLHVTVPGAGSVVDRLEVPAVLGAAGPAPATDPLPSFLYSGVGTLVVSLLVGVLVLAAMFVLVRARRGSWVKQRLAAHLGEAEAPGGLSSDRLSFLAALFRATEGAFGRRSQWRSIEKLLVRGDIPLRPAEFVWTMIGSGTVGGLLGALLSLPALLILVLMGGGASVPYFFVAMRVRRRAKAFENQLPDLLTTIAASLKAGHSFKHGLQSVVDESTPPASLELKRVLTEAGLGRPMDDALADMADRTGSENFQFAITAVTIQRQVGGSLATLFDMVSETVRNRQQFARKIRSLTAMGRMSAYTLVAIPFFIAAMIWLTNKSYLDPLVHTSMGHVMLLVGLVMMGIGSMILKKIVSFRG
jgi:tight adherence protein B